jgi:hypothetical protein
LEIKFTTSDDIWSGDFFKTLAREWQGSATSEWPSIVAGPSNLDHSFSSTSKEEKASLKEGYIASIRIFKISPQDQEYLRSAAIPPNAALSVAPSSVSNEINLTLEDVRSANRESSSIKSILFSGLSTISSESHEGQFGILELLL